MNYEHLTPDEQDAIVLANFKQAEADHFIHTLHAEAATAEGKTEQADALTALASAAEARATVLKARESATVEAEK